MNDRMRACLRQAIEELWGSVEAPPTNRETMLERSVRHGHGGFSTRTLWRALEIATAEPRPSWRCRLQIHRWIRLGPLGLHCWSEACSRCGKFRAVED